MGMKAIILAGGTGSRLYPMSRISSKQLLAVYDKPMIYYPLTVLIAAGIRKFCIISTPHDLPRFRDLLGDGSQWGISIVYYEQPRPEGIAQAFLIAEDFIAGENVALMLGDNFFFGGDAFPRAVSGFTSGAMVFAYRVTNPEHYGVVEFDSSGRAISLEEKPKQPKSSFAVPGLYLYDRQVVDIASSLRPSPRGELEITDINRIYLEKEELQVHRLSRGFVWLDTGTSSTLHEAASYVETIERRQGVKLGCPEEAALVRKFLSVEAFRALIDKMPRCGYRDYLSGIASEFS